MPPIKSQDIPLEASETVSFTPESLAAIPGAPVFTLRSPTKRDERHHRRLIREDGLIQHSDEALRGEIFTALAALWTPEDYERHAARIRDYYTAVDDFALQRRDDPELKWEWPAEEETAVRTAIGDAIKAWPKLRRMTADNAEFQEMRAPLIAAVVIASWSELATERHLDRGYLSLDCAEQLIEDLEAFERKHEVTHKLDAGTATFELYAACIRRLYLDEEEVGNSVSSPPSPTPPPSSSARRATGRSKARATSPETPAIA